MKGTKQATPGTSGRSAVARGKFWKVCMVLLLLVTVVFCGFAPRAWALEQNAEGVYELHTAQDLKDFRDGINNKTINSTANAKLTADIDLGGEPWTPIGTGPYPQAYEGTFDGGGFTVSGVKVDIDNGFGVYAGFFGFIYGNVKNLNVSGEISAESSGEIYIGGIAGSVQFDGWGVPEGANITNCSFSGSVNADSTDADSTKGHVCAGGVVGQTVGATIAGCTYTGGSVTAVCGGQGANNRVGGIVGQADSYTVVDSCTASSEKISASGESALNMAGGIAGRMYFAKMTNCTAASLSIKAKGGEDNDAGGITGNAHQGQMSGCAYTGGAGSITATGENNTGGISGDLEFGSSVSDCAWNEDSSENAAGMGDYCVVEETTKALPAEKFKSGEIILSVTPSCSVVNLTPDGSSALSFTAQPGGKPLTQEQAAKYIAVQETEYSTFSIDTSAWPYVVTGTDVVDTEELVFSFYATNIVTGKPAEAPTGSVTMTVVNAETPAVPVTGISGITPAELSMPAGGTQQLAAAVTPANATNNLSAITWSSDDETVATVDKNGVVTAVAPGSATITAKANDETATCAVTVSASPQPAPPSGGGSGGGGGCSAGFGALALLAVVPLFARRKK